MAKLLLQLIALLLSFSYNPLLNFCIAQLSPSPSPSVEGGCSPISLIPCLPFVQNNSSSSSPASLCCSGLQPLLSSQNFVCVCTLFSAISSFPFINLTRTLQLPPLCNLTAPSANTCSAILGAAPGSSPASLAPITAAAPLTSPPAPPTVTLAPLTPPISPSLPQATPSSPPAPPAPVPAVSSPPAPPVGPVSAPVPAQGSPLSAPSTPTVTAPSAPTPSVPSTTQPPSQAPTTSPPPVTMSSPPSGAPTASSSSAIPETPTSSGPPPSPTGLASTAGPALRRGSLPVLSAVLMLTAAAIIPGYRMHF